MVEIGLHIGGQAVAGSGTALIWPSLNVVEIGAPSSVRNPP